jgi:hypothetical protein
VYVYVVLANSKLASNGTQLVRKEDNLLIDEAEILWNLLPYEELLLMNPVSKPCVLER